MKPADFAAVQIPEPPAAAVALFGARLDHARAYAELLAAEAVPRGLLGPREIPRLWDRHLLNCAVIEELLPRDARVCDLGSGAGLPGLVLAILRPDLRMTLLEPMLRRAAFLTQVVEQLGCASVTVVRARAEEAAIEPVDVVVARAVAPLDRLAGWAIPLLREEGQLLAVKGTAAAEEVDKLTDRWSELGVAAARVEQVGGDYVQPPTTVVRLVRAQHAGGVRRGARRRPGRRQGTRT